MTSRATRARPTPSDAAPAPAADCTTVDQVCEWLAQARPSLDEVAERLRHPVVVERELGHVVELLRQHVFAAMGEPIRRGTGLAEEPF